MHERFANCQQVANTLRSCHDGDLSLTLIEPCHISPPATVECKQVKFIKARCMPWSKQTAARDIYIPAMRTGR